MDSTINQLEKLEISDQYQNDLAELYSSKLLPVAREVFKKYVANFEITTLLDTNVLHKIMNYLFDDICAIDLENLQEVPNDIIRSAKKYKLQDLKTTCEMSLSKIIRLDNVLKLAAIAEENDAILLAKNLVNFIVKHKKLIRELPEFDNFCKSYPGFLHTMFWIVWSNKTLRSQSSNSELS